MQTDLLGDDVNRHTADFGFTAHAPNRDGQFTQFGFMDVAIGMGLREHAAFINRWAPAALSFSCNALASTAPAGESVDLNLIHDWHALTSLGFVLEHPVRFELAAQRWQAVQGLNHLALLGQHAPAGLDFSGKLAGLNTLLIDHAVFTPMAGQLTQTRDLELRAAPKSWAGHELQAFQNLKRLKLNACGLQRLPEALLHTPLEMLILAGCRGLGDLNLLRQMKQLKYLHIYSCPRMLDFSFLHDMPQLRALDISRPITDVDLRSLPALDFYAVHSPKRELQAQSFVRRDGESLRQIGTAPIDELVARGVFAPA